jgi:hypothetical protein
VDIERGLSWEGFVDVIILVPENVFQGESEFQHSEGI